MTVRNPRRPAGRVLAARWALVLASAALLLSIVLALLGVFVPRVAAAAHPCVVSGYAVSDGAVLCADGRSFGSLAAPATAVAR